MLWRVLFLIAGVFVALGILEGMLRVAPHLMPETARMYASRQNAGDGRVRTVPHPSIGYLYKPNLQAHFQSQDFTFQYETDEKGFRNSEPWPNRAEIVAIGDSLTFGFGLERARTWVALLEQALQEQRILNLGLLGSGPQQYLRVYEAFGRSVQPKVVLVGVFLGNDLKDAQEFQAWINSGAEGNYSLWRFTRVSSLGFSHMVARLIKRSYLFAFVLDRIRWAQNPYKGNRTTVQLDDGKNLQLVPEVLYHIRRLGRPETDAFQLMLAALEQLHRLSTHDGAQTLVLLLPTKEEVYLPLVAEEEILDPTLSIRKALDEAGIPYVDLAPAFRARAAEGQGLFFETDGHPNHKGHALIAEVVLNYLRNSEH